MLRVFYTPEAVSQPASFSPSAYKPKIVVEDWQRTFGDKIAITKHGPIDSEWLAYVHDKEYVEGVLTGQYPTGFGKPDRAVAKSCLYTCGGLITAAEYVLSDDDPDQPPLACAPYSGFHHAHHGRGYGYCTFNGLAATALHMVESDQAENVLILDCDYHYGDGTQDILDRHESDAAGFVRHWTAGDKYWDRQQAAAFLKELPQVIRRNKMCDLVLYQAGADPHLKDPLGGFLTYEQLRLRDRIVFETCAELGMAVVWTLAGGYQSPLERTLKIHHATMEEALAYFD